MNQQCSPNQFLVLEIYFGKIEDKSCNMVELDIQSEALHCVETVDLDCTIVWSSKTSFLQSKSTNVEIDTICWNLYLDGSNYKEDVGARSILMNPKGNWILVVSQLDFACINNTIEYEVILQSLPTEIDLKVKNIKVYNDSKIMFYP